MIINIVYMPPEHVSHLVAFSIGYVIGDGLRRLIYLIYRISTGNDDEWRDDD